MSGYVASVVITAVGALVPSCTIVAVMRWRKPAGRVRAWTSVWADGSRIVAEGVADDAIVSERFLILLNGRPVRMVMVHIDFEGGTPRWQAQDLSSYEGRQIPGLRARYGRVTASGG